MGALDIDDVSRRFGGVAALDRVTLRVEDGEFCVVVGPSGCGKSTLLRAVAGLERVDSGSVRIDGEDVTERPPRDRDVAVVFQSYALYPHLSARQNLEFPLKVRGLPAAERGERVREAAELLGIADLLDRRPRELSGGQRQRVAMGRAIVRRPKLFLFDEPLSNLDARLRSRMRVELVELHRRLRSTAVYVTHDQAEAMTLGTKVVVMEGGTVRQQGAPREVYEQPVDEFVAGFLGSPAMTFLRGEVRGGRFRAAGGELPAEGVAGGAAVLGVRPEDWRSGGSGQSGDIPFELEVRLVEDLGSDRFAFGRIGDAEAIVRLPEDGASPSAGERVAIAPDPRRLHWFIDGRRVGATLTRPSE